MRQVGILGVIALTLSICTFLNFGLFHGKKVELTSTELYGLGKTENNTLSWISNDQVKYYVVLKSVKGQTKWEEIAKISGYKEGNKEHILFLVDNEPSTIEHYKIISVSQAGKTCSNEIQINRSFNQHKVRA